MPDEETLPELAQLPDDLRRLLTRCPVTLSLFAAAKARRPLTAPQRHVLIQVFALMGDPGKRFIHQVLAAGPGYDPDLVNRDIHSVSPQPIGCHRIRQHLKLDAVRDGCNCTFKLDQDSYASPQCHLDRLPITTTPVLRRRPDPTDLDEDGRTKGYLSRRAKARAITSKEEDGLAWLQRLVRKLVG